MNVVKTGMLLAALTALFLGVGWLVGGTTGAVIAFVIALATNAYAYWNSDSLALRMHGAREVDARSAPEFHGMIEDLARRADLPMPRVFIIETDQPNAFATGRNPENAAVAATTGIMRALSREELAGVMAHELAHVKNRDTLIMTIVATFSGAISFLATFAQFGMLFGGGASDEEEGGSPLGMVGLLIAAILAPMAAMIVQMAISRTREYSADRMGGEICGNPLWLASALAKISRLASGAAMRSAERHPETAHLFIVNPLSGRRFASLFSTHPDPSVRIGELQKQATAMGLGEAGGDYDGPAMGGRLEPAPTPAGARTPRARSRSWGPPSTKGSHRDGPRRGDRRGPWA